MEDLIHVFSIAMFDYRRVHQVKHHRSLMKKTFNPHVHDKIRAISMKSLCTMSPLDHLHGPHPSCSETNTASWALIRILNTTPTSWPVKTNHESVNLMFDRAIDRPEFDPRHAHVLFQSSRPVFESKFRASEGRHSDMEVSHPFESDFPWSKQSSSLGYPLLMSIHSYGSHGPVKRNHDFSHE